MLLMNLESPCLYSGTWLVKKVLHCVTEATILTGCGISGNAFISRIPLIQISNDPLPYVDFSSFFDFVLTCPATIRKANTNDDSLPFRPSMLLALPIIRQMLKSWMQKNVFVFAPKTKMKTSSTVRCYGPSSIPQPLYWTGL